MKDDLKPSLLLDYESEEIQALLRERQWAALNPKEQIQAAYHFVRDEIYFGYNRQDALPASQILKDGYGQCNTKGILFMALLRALGTICRIHGFYVDKRLQKGAATGLIYRMAPKEILHSWVEVFYMGTWYELEGLILDEPYKAAVQKRFCTGPNPFCGYGIAVEDLSRLSTDWNLCNTYIQKEAITRDLGVFSTPDAFYEQYDQALPLLKEWLFVYGARHLMNWNVKRMRRRALKKQGSKAPV